MFSQAFSTPILLVSFLRPVHIRQVLDSIRIIKPSNLYVFQDGPRGDNDVNRIAEVRGVIKEAIDWSCHLHTFYSKTNFGCGPGPAAAISWFFEHVDRGIILEDDAVPHPDFFAFAEDLLERYDSDSSVRAIGSMNVDTQRWGDGSYYFSMMNRNLCAWATWRRAWRSFDINMKGVSRHGLDKALRQYHCGPLERAYWLDRLDEVHKDACGGKSWDMQFFMSIWLNHGKGIIPNVNLSSNIGTVGEATHAMAAGNIIDNVPTQPILPLTHPTDTNVQVEAGKKDWPWYLIIYNILNRRVKRLVGHQGPWIKRKQK